jgi:hypothetical protein
MYQNNKTIKEVGHQRLGPFFIVKQINVMAFQLKLPGSMKMFSIYNLEHNIIKQCNFDKISKSKSRSYISHIVLVEL